MWQKMDNYKRSPKISIITVCYNAESEIECTIRSVLEQTFIDYEYIIVDGGSKDNTMQIVNKYRDKITYIISEPDLGIYDAMNKGIKLASGEWLNMMNAGDKYVDENVLENVFKNHVPDNVWVLYSDYYMYKSNGQIVRYNVDLINKSSFNHQCTIYRRFLHQMHGYYIVTKEIIISDILFFYAIPTNQMMKIDTVIAYFVGGGISSKGNWSMEQWLCADVVFRKRTFGNMVVMYYYRRLKKLIPQSLKDFIKGVVKWKGKNVSL